MSKKTFMSWKTEFNCSASNCKKKKIPSRNIKAWQMIWWNGRSKSAKLTHSKTGIPKAFSQKSLIYGIGTILIDNHIVNRWTISSKLSTWLSWMRPDRWKISHKTTDLSFRKENVPWEPNRKKGEGRWKSSQKIQSRDNFSIGKTSWIRSTLQGKKTRCTFNNNLKPKKDNWKIFSRSNWPYLRRSTKCIRIKPMLRRNILQLWPLVARKSSKLFRKMMSGLQR